MSGLAAYATHVVTSEAAVATVRTRATIVPAPLVSAGPARARASARVPAVAAVVAAATPAGPAALPLPGGPSSATADAPPEPAAAALAEMTAPDPLFPRPVAFRTLRRLILDPGHGGDNLGTVGVLGVREKVLALQVSQHIAAYLRAHSDLEVVLTRLDDTAIELRDRPRIANQLGGDALISVHANAHEDGLAQGMEVFFLSADSSAEATRHAIEAEAGLADVPDEVPWSVEAIVTELGQAAAHARSQALAEALASALQKVRPGVRFRGVRQAPFGVLKEARMPAIVLELGYLTHPQEGRTLLEPGVHRAFARAILLALANLEAATAAERLAAKP